MLENDFLICVGTPLINYTIRIADMVFWNLLDLFIAAVKGKDIREPQHTAVRVFKHRLFKHVLFGTISAPACERHHCIDDEI